MPLPPAVNSGEFQFTVNDNDEIIYGLGAIKGLGEGPIESIILARKDGPLTDVCDFGKRIDPRRVNKRALEALVRSGALDELGPGQNIDYDRAVMFAALGDAVQAAEQSTANENAGIMDLFGEVVPSQQNTGDVYAEFSRVRPWTIKQRLEGEKETLGLYLTGHPIDEYAAEVKHLVSNRISDLRADKKAQKIAGLVVAFRTMKTKRGDTMAFVALDDRSGRIEVAIFADAYKKYSELLTKDALLVVTGQVNLDEYSGGLKMRAEEITTLAQARLEKAKALRLHVTGDQCPDTFANQLLASLAPYKQGQCPVLIEYQRPGAKASLRLGKDWCISPEDELVANLKEVLGKQNVELLYD